MGSSDCCKAHAEILVVGPQVAPIASAVNVQGGIL
jgi:hypothetical protein